MPPKPTIDFDQVANYAEAIKAAGVKPTARLIRERHGSGSLGTIQPLLVRWEAEQAHVSDSMLTLPSSLQRVILEFVQSELSAGRAGLEARLAESTTTVQDFATENDRQTTQIEMQINSLELLQTEKSMLEGRLSEIETTLTSTRDEAVRERQAAESSRIELAKLMLRLEGIPRLEADLTEIRKEYQVVDQRRQAIERDLAVSKSESQLLEQSRNDLIRGLEARLAETQEQLRITSTQLRETQQERLKVTAELAMAQATRADDGARAAERIGKLEGTLAVLEKAAEQQAIPL